MSSNSYQATWLLGACIAAGLAALYLLHLLRVRQVRARMEGKLDEMDRIVRDLLDSIQGVVLKIHAVVRQMPSDDPARQALEKILDHADHILAESSHRARSQIYSDQSKQN